MLANLPNLDLAGQVYPSPNILQTKKRLDSLIDRYITPTLLYERLEDLPIQFLHPQPRRWQQIHWHTINPKQLININLELFVSILIGAIETEEPIRGYTQTSRQYLEPIAPQLARFVGGIVAPDGTMLELGLWEKEERQHAPALSKIYQQLTGKKPTFSSRIPKPYQPFNNPSDDLYRHGLHRVITEYSAVCLYLWLMAQTTGTLQQVFGELLLDEINHLTKFWGFGLWLFPQSYFSLILDSFGQIFVRQNPTEASHIQATLHLFRTFRRMIGVLNWTNWSPHHKLELVYTSIKVLRILWGWSASLKREYLQELFAETRGKNKQ